MVQKKVIIIGVVAVLAIIGVIAAIMLSSKGSEDASNKSNLINDEKSSSVSNDGFPVNNNNSSSPSSSTTSLRKPLSDASNAIFTVSALAIGDWGRTIAKDGGSCCSRRTEYTITDYNAMEYTASLLGVAAKEMNPKPQAILGHGDNFYWTGIVSKLDQDYRFVQTFEEKYSDASLMEIPWINVMGNHDYGGSSFICGDGQYTAAECKDTAEMLANLELKFTLQQTYTSPNNNRWILTDHYYKHTIQGTDGTVIDIFNIDTNDAESHGADQICCQCHGYSNGESEGKEKGICRKITRGHPYCAGGNTDMYDACMKQLKSWADDSRKKLVAGVKESKADWKIVNTHYSPYNHYGPEKSKLWKEMLSGLGIQLWINGHTHGEKHDWVDFNMHFIENGAGGGIQAESPSGLPNYAKDYVSNVWSAGGYPYGIFELSASKDWMKVRFLTFDNTWVMNEDLAKSAIGGVRADHCWYIPVDGTQGKSCDAL